MVRNIGGKYEEYINLGATGSIGTQTLDVIRKSEGAINLVAVSANSSKKIIDIIEEFSPKYVAMMDKKAYKDIKEYCSSNNKNISVYSGIDGLIKVASLDGNRHSSYICSRYDRIKANYSSY